MFFFAISIIYFHTGATGRRTTQLVFSRPTNNSRMYLSKTTVYDNSHLNSIKYTVFRPMVTTINAIQRYKYCNIK